MREPGDQAAKGPLMLLQSSCSASNFPRRPRPSTLLATTWNPSKEEAAQAVALNDVFSVNTVNTDDGPCWLTNRQVGFLTP